MDVERQVFQIILETKSLDSKGLLAVTCTASWFSELSRWAAERQCQEYETQHPGWLSQEQRSKPPLERLHMMEQLMLPLKFSRYPGLYFDGDEQLTLSEDCTEAWSSGPGVRAICTEHVMAAGSHWVEYELENMGDCNEQVQVGIVNAHAPHAAQALQAAGGVPGMVNCAMFHIDMRGKRSVLVGLLLAWGQDGVVRLTRYQDRKPWEDPDATIIEQQLAPGHRTLPDAAYPLDPDPPFIWWVRIPRQMEVRIQQHSEPPAQED